MVMFKKANIEDAEELCSIATRAFLEDKLKYGSCPPGIDTVKWHVSYIKDGMYYKMVYDKVICGGFKLFNLGKLHYRLGAIFIEPAYQNKGIGSKAIEFIEKSFPEGKRWSLDTPYLSYAVHHFYEKNGYVKVGEEKPDKKDDFCLFLYEKEIK